MSRNRAELRITLRSDLCMGSGYAYAGIVDSDVCYNPNGIPYIPGRRLKGCLREAGELIGLENLDEIFGISGLNRVQGIYVGNAWPVSMESIDRELTELKRTGSPWAKYLGCQQILNQFSRIKAQTCIDPETGAAKDSSLRFIRVVNQYSAIDQKPMEFVAEVEFDCSAESLNKAVKALRHIGMERNRGLGQVCCRLENIRPSGAWDIPREEKDGEDLVRLNYMVQNVQPLMMTGNQGDISELYISGQSVLGALAAAYLSQSGTDAEDELFKQLFIKGRTIFTNLNLCMETGEMESGTYREFIPAPMFLKRMKKSRKLVNSAIMAGEDEKDPEYDPAGGNQPKKLNNQYVCFLSDNQVMMAEPDLEIVYHHSKKQKSPNGEEGILYTQEVLREGQLFSGSIITPRRYAGILRVLLTHASLRFGKSKSAQYGACKLAGEIGEEIYDPEIKVNAGERILAAMTSDAAFLGECGYITRYQDVKQKLAEDLGISYIDQPEEEYVFIQTKVASGYQTVWNLQKPGIPVIGAGSIIEYTVDKDCTIRREFAGEKNREGYGQIRIFHKKDMRHKVDACLRQYSACEPNAALPVLEKTLMSALTDSLKERIFEKDRAETVRMQKEISSSTLGRVTLMLEESLNQNRDDYRAAWTSFKERVESIKRDKERGLLQKYIYRYIAGDEEIMIRDIDRLDEYQDLKKLGIKELPDKINALWGDYLMQVFVYQKYLKKGDA